MIEIVSDAAVAQVASGLDVGAAVREALIVASEEGAPFFPVLRAQGVDPSQGVNVKFGVAAAAGLVGGKIGTYWPAAAERGLARHAASTVLLDVATGRPRALVAALRLNRLRTAAADALAVDALARPDATVLAVIGAGAQAVFEARAVAQVRSLSELRIGARDPAAAARTACELGSLGVAVTPTDIASALRGADIVVTATAARAPLLRWAELAPGAHVSAMGADAVGKQELEPEILTRARLFADLPSQAIVVGELQHARVSVHAITPLGRVLAGAAGGRRSPDEITVFDSSGLAAQDLFVAEAALVAARGAGLVQTVEFM